MFGGLHRRGRDAEPDRRRCFIDAAPRRRRRPAVRVRPGQECRVRCADRDWRLPIGLQAGRSAADVGQAATGPWSSASSASSRWTRCSRSAPTRLDLTDADRPKSEDANCECEDLTFGYGDEHRPARLVVRRPPGSIFAIMGGSGCGKSTLLKAMIGLLRPAPGRSWSTARITGPPPRHAAPRSAAASACCSRAARCGVR